MSDINIKELRKKVGLSQAKFAEMLGVHSRTVQNWEKGGVVPESKYAILRKMESEDINTPEALNNALYSPPIDVLLGLLRDKDRHIDRLLTMLENEQKNTIDDLREQIKAYREAVAKYDGKSVVGELPKGKKIANL